MQIIRSKGKNAHLYCRKFSLFGLFLVLPSFLGLTIFYLLPFFGSLYYTFTQGVAEPHFVGLANFRDLAVNPMFRQAVRNTIVFLAVGVFMLLGVAMMVSVIAAKRPFRWQRWALLLPMAVPAASLALGWQSLWGAGGTVGQLLRMPETDFLEGFLAFPLLVLLYILKNVGYLSVIFISAIQAQPPECRESYRLESSSEAGYVFRILLPMISPTLLFAVVVAVMNYFLLFRDIYTLYGDNPPRQIYMLQHFMNSNFYHLNYQRLSTAAFLTILVLTVLISITMLLQRRATRHVG